MSRPAPDPARTTWWGIFAGVITLALVAFPLSAAFAFATHPATNRLFGDPLDAGSRVGYGAFWWLMVLLIAALPVLVGFGVARLDTKGLAIAGASVAVVVIAVVVLGQVFVF